MRLESLALADDIVQLRLIGRLDLVGTREIDDQFSSAATARKGKLIVDLSQVTFITSIGIRMLMACAKAQMSRGGELILASPHPQIRQVIQASGIDQLVGCAEDIESAIAKLKSAA